MLDFTYFTPTKIYFGKDKHKEIGKIIRQFGYTKIMMQYGKNSIKKSGLYDEVINSLRKENITVIECGGVEPNPKLSFVRDAVKIAKKENVEMILAVGGGSVLDSSKSTALGATSENDVWDIQMGEVSATSALPVGCILTHSAAGSEMSASTVITNSETNTKKGLTTNLVRCKFSILNPELTYSVSKYQTACGIVDMLAHTMERYFTTAEPVELTDRIAEGIMKTIISNGKIVMDNPTDYEARANLMWASSLSHNGLTGCGREAGFTVHPIEHAISGIYDQVAHGAGLAVLYPAWAKFIYKYAPQRFARFARIVWDIKDDNDMSASVKGINAMEDYFAQIGMPVKLSELDVNKESIETLASHCTLKDTIKIGSYIPLGKKEIAEILELCY